MNYDYNARIDRWVDGDTVDVVVDLGFSVYSAQRLRLNGIDTPERGQPGYAEATEYARGIAPIGSSVVINTHKGQGKYGRYLADITTEGGGDLVAMMLDANQGKPYDGGKRA